ncbi:MAG: hypothetical protein QOJ37_3854, partial [Pseudonocardiales bacterium]|nr:hypothetical protein [Pseudonocardiales bacterium]
MRRALGVGEFLAVAGVVIVGFVVVDQAGSSTVTFALPCSSHGPACVGFAQRQ